MLILLDCRPLQQEGRDSERSRFIISCVHILSRERGIDWLFLADGALPVDWLPVSLGKLLPRRTLAGMGGWKLWYDWQLPLATRRYKPDIVMTTAGIASGRLSVPQCVWMPERVQGKGGKKKKYRRMYQKRLPGTLLRAQCIFTFSAKDKEFLISQVKEVGQSKSIGQSEDVATRIFVVPPAVDSSPGPDPQEKKQVKETWSAGKEYFFTDIAAAGQKEIVALLKSFSLFKKRQRSNMQLVLAGKGLAPDKALADLLATYKYRGDIHWAPPLSEEEGLRLAGASYAILFPFEKDSLGLHLLNAWNTGVPVITTTAVYPPELAGEAVLLAQPGDPASLAAQLMLIYKDEGLRNQLIGKGVEQGRTYSWERSAAIVWAGITAINN